MKTLLDRAEKLAVSKLSWAVVLAVSVAISIFAALRGGYVGPDYSTHLGRLTELGKVFDFSTTSPPTYYLLGYALFKIIGFNNMFPVTLSIIQSLTNAVALWFFFRLSQRQFKLQSVHFALILLLAFLPVRMIHTTTIGTDSTTIPLFVLLLYAFRPLLAPGSSNERSAAVFGLSLALAIFTKYSFMALLPTVFIVLLFFAYRRQWRVKQLVTIGLLTLLLPTLLSLFSFWASSRVHGYNTEKHWLPPGVPSDMDYRDLLTVHQKDALLFQAPEYFKREILEGHKHSYLGLSHLGVFTDTMNLFQILPVPQRIETYLGPEQKTREPWKTKVMIASMSLGVLWTLLALAGTAWTFWMSLRDLFKDRMNPEDVAALFGTAYFLLMYLPIPFVYAADLYGYWTPRLILPPLLYFFAAGFFLCERKIIRESAVAALVLLLLVGLQCAIEIVMLV